MVDNSLHVQILKGSRNTLEQEEQLQIAYDGQIEAEEELPEAVEADRAQAKKEGKVRYIGFSGHRDYTVHQRMIESFDGCLVLSPHNQAVASIEFRFRH